MSLGEVKELICGKYAGRYAKGWEFFEIKPDGTFNQVFVQNGKTNYNSQGTWSFKKFEDRYFIEFKSFMNLSETILTGKPPEDGMARATYFDDEPRIYFSQDIDYFITKQPETGNTNSVVK